MEGRFCFEGGSHCGKGEGLHVLITDQAHEISRDFDLASQGRLSPKRRPNNFKRNEGMSKLDYFSYTLTFYLFKMNLIFLFFTIMHLIVN